MAETAQAALNDRASNAISGSEDRRVIAALEEYLRLYEAGEAPHPGEFAQQYPDISQALETALAGLVFMQRAAGGVESSSQGISRQMDLEASPLQSLGDYRIIREIGRGGMGIVYEAEQLSLARRVALKILPFAAVLDARHLQRFKNEALAAAHLDHPHIVDVYGVGCERGIHFYAMRYIEGPTLADVIDGLKCGVRNAERGIAEITPDADAAADTPNSELHTPRSGDTVAAALSTLRTERPKDFFRRVAELGIQGALALEHAHQMGIVHRDIKPSNLMLDESGKLWITDFGLARVESDTALTMTGDVVGTLRYMSPEQADGKATVLDHRTDIYSFGLTLYELLTLRPPFETAARKQLVRDIAEAEPKPPRRINAAVPPELETIVLKCISKEPLDRYKSAAALADDLRRWLDEKPILARPPGLVQRAAKWSRRHSTTLAASTALLTIVVVAFVAALVWVTQAYREKTLESARASANLRQTHEVIDRLLTRVAENRLLKAPHMDELRKALLLDALDANTTLLTVNDKSPAARYELAKAHLRASQILGDLGDNTQSVEHAKQALALAEVLYTADGSEQHQVLLAQSYSRVAGTASPHLMAKAVALIESLVAAHPESEDYRLKLARGYNNLAVCMMRTGRPEEAIELYRKSIAKAPNIAQFHTNLASLLAMLKRHEEAADELRAAIKLGDPTDPHLIPWTRYTLGCVLDEMGRGDEARAELQTALAEIDAVVSDHPKVTEWRRQQAYNLITLGECMPPADLPEAIALGKRAVGTIEELLRQTKENPADQKLLEIAQKNLETWKTRLRNDAGR